MKTILRVPIAAVAVCLAIACDTSDKAIAEEPRPEPAPMDARVAAPAPVAAYSFIVKPQMVAPEEWGSEPDDMSDLLHTPKYLTVHHDGVAFAAGSDPAAKIKTLQTWGKAEKDWPDVPYHYLIAPDGTIYEGRSTDYMPETNTDYDVSGHIGIDVMGNFEEQRVSKAQLRSLVHLLAWLANTHSIDMTTLGSHRDAAPGQTVCPGADLHRYIESGLIYEWAIAFPTGQDLEIDVLPPLEGGPVEFVPGGE